MSTTKKSTAGRKPMLTIDEKKDIVNRYLIAHGQDPTVLTKHGVCENLARFARSLQATYSNVRGYHFYDADIKVYISGLANDFSDTDKAKQIGCAYIPLDLTVINQLARGHRYKEMIAILREREDYLANLYNKIAQAAAQNEFIISKYNIKACELQAQAEKLAALETETGRLTRVVKDKSIEINALKYEVRALKRIVHEKEDEIAILCHNTTMRGLGLHDNLKALVKREENRIVKAPPEQKMSSGCEIIKLVPEIED